MVLVHIACNTREQAKDIIGLLLNKKLIADAMISKKESFNSAQMSGTRCFLIIARTKALLFNPLNQEVTNKYPSNTPLLYCIPIVYMDPVQSQYLLDNTMKV